MNINKSYLAGVLGLVCASILTSSTVFSHHGVTGQFDLDQNVTVTGTVNRVRFVNPHGYVYFKVINEAGEEEQWRCELRSGSLLKRRGWTEEMFAPGTKITVNGSPDRRDSKTCYAHTITFADGKIVDRRDSLNDAGEAMSGERELKREDGTPNFEGNWTEPPRGRGRGRGTRPPRFVMSQIAREEGVKYTEADNPRFMCEPTNIILDYNFDQMVNKFEQSETKIVITYGFMDVVRTIHLDGEFPETIEPSVTGYSVGKWEGDTLVVRTKGFGPGFLRAPGGRPGPAIRHGEQMEITERFYLNEASNELKREYTVVDPVYLAQPHTHQNTSVLTSDPFLDYDCDDLTVDKYAE